MRILGCRHGLLLLLLHSSRNQVLVWDPVTGDQRRIDVPPGFYTGEENGAVLRAAGDVHGGDRSSPFQFQVVLLSYDKEFERALVLVYSSETGVWSDPISTACRGMSADLIPCSLVGSSLYWYLVGPSSSKGILEFDLDRQRLAVIDVPSNVPNDIWVIPAEGCVLGLLCRSKLSIHLWKRETDCDGVAGWMLRRTIMLDSVLPLSRDEPCYPMIVGFAEDDNALLIGTIDRVFTIQLDSMKFMQSNICLETLNSYNCYPFSSVYTAGMGIGGEPEGAELLCNTQDDLV